jgi:pimeloyl-ACP methyl ester carboxylesterase
VHIDQLEAELERLASTGPVVLVGHSYGGMVITAVADRHPERVGALVYLDADVPDDEESCWSLAPPEIRDSLIQGAAENGLTLAPLPFFDERARPHPLATVVQAVRLTGAWKQIPVKVFVAALDTPGGLQAPASMAKVRDDPDWRYEEWHTSHNVLRDGPTAVVNLLLSIDIPADHSSRST